MGRRRRDPFDDILERMMEDLWAGMFSRRVVVSTRALEKDYKQAGITIHHPGEVAAEAEECGGAIIQGQATRVDQRGRGVAAPRLSAPRTSPRRWRAGQ